MSVGRDEKLPVDLYNDDEDAIVSSAYYVFEVININVLLPEYLFMWLCRPENDRYIGFISGVMSVEVFLGKLFAIFLLKYLPS